MPSKSPEQHRLMEAVKHNAKFAAKVGIPQSVGRDFVAADEKKERKLGMSEHPQGTVSKVPHGYGR